MKFTEIQRKLHHLLNEYEAAVIAENRGRNRSCYNEIENKYYQKRMELKEFVAELESAQRWIPVSEPPKIDGTYLLRNIYEDVYSCYFIANTNTWVVDGYDMITHWMPIPQPPEVQE